MTDLTGKPGLGTLIEIAMSYVEASCPEISTADYDTIQFALTRFLRGELTYDECRQHFLATINRDNALVRLQEILSVPSEPIPYHGEAPSDDGRLSLRRRTRPWTTGEDQRLLAGIVRFGLDNWQAVAHFVGSGRNRAQCSQRWSRGLNPRISKRAWTAVEDQQLQDLVRQYGEKSWAKIASILGNRSDVQCRYHYRQTVGGADDFEETLPLATNKLTGSTATFFRGTEPTVRLPPPPPEPPARKKEERLSLLQSRQCISSPMLTTPQTIRHALPAAKDAPVIVPKAPVKVGEATAKRPTFGIVGSDPDSLNMFLRHFS
jgi:hypothetical protein